MIELFFPKFCLSCQKEGEYLCQDCLSLAGVMESSFCLCEKPQRLPDPGKCRNCRKRKLDGLYFAVSYGNNIVKRLIHRLKYEPCIKDLSLTLAQLIFSHLMLLEKNFDEKKFVFVPVPLTKRKLKRRGFNQSEEIAKKLSKLIQIPTVSNCLLKIKETAPQMEISGQERKENIKDAFVIKDKRGISGKKILLVDDVYTTGSTLEECARILKEAEAEEVWGLVVAREELNKK